MKINTKATVWCTNGHRSIKGSKGKLNERRIMYNTQKEKFIEAYIFYNHCSPNKAKQKYEYLISQNSSYISELIFGYTMELRRLSHKGK